MGMDYQYAGSAAYPRFDEEIYGIVKLFGGIKSIELEERESNQTGIDYWFGAMSSADSKMPKYIFPENTNKALIEWFNNIYDEYTSEETNIVYAELLKFKDEIEVISHQVLCELEQLCEMSEGWSIS